MRHAMRHVPVLIELDAGVAAAGDDGVGGGEPGVEDGVELAVAADAGLALHPDEVGGRVDGRREEVLRRADAELDQVLPASGHHRGGGGGPAPPVRGGRRAAAAAGARHGDPRAVGLRCTARRMRSWPVRLASTRASSRRTGAGSTTGMARKSRSTSSSSMSMAGEATLRVRERGGWCSCAACVPCLMAKGVE